MPAPRKTAICSHWQASGSCAFGENCHFAHGTNELSSYVAPPAAYAPYPQANGYSGAMRAPYGHYRPYVPQRNSFQSAAPYGTPIHRYAIPPAAPAVQLPRGIEAYRGTRPELFKTTMCRNLLQTGACAFGNGCSFAHDQSELRSAVELPVAASPQNYYDIQPQVGLKRPVFPGVPDAPPRKRIRRELYKTMMCTHFVSSGSCPFAATCNFAHDESEMRKFPEALTQ